MPANFNRLFGDAVERIPTILDLVVRLCGQKRWGRRGSRPYQVVTTKQDFPSSAAFARYATLMPKGDGIHRDVGRQTPAPGAHIFVGKPNIFFVTVNAKDAV